MNVQLKKGVLDLCVLRLLMDSPTYGYNIYQKINDVMPISESTIYPILRKMVSEKWVTTSLESSPDGPPRRYFKMTPLGVKTFDTLQSEWFTFNHQIQRILGDESV